MSTRCLLLGMSLGTGIWACLIVIAHYFYTVVAR